MKKILFAINQLHGGGAERVATLLANYLSDKYDVSILVKFRNQQEYSLSPKVVVHTIANSEKKFLQLGKLKRLAIRRKITKTVSPDVLITFLSKTQISMMIATLGMKINKIETVRNSPWNENLSPLMLRLWKKCFNRADGVIFQTQEQGEFFSDKIREKSIILPNPVSNVCFEKERKYSDKITDFVAVGRLAPQKNYPLMIKAFSKAVEENNDLKLHIFGGGSEKEIADLTKLIESLDLNNNVFLMGRSENVFDEVLQRDAFIMSSDFEGMPNALMEAMTLGTVCISTNCRTGPKDLIDDGQNGFLVSVNDEKELTNAILNVSKLSLSEQINIGTNAKQKIISIQENNGLEKLEKMIEGFKTK